MGFQHLVKLKQRNQLKQLSSSLAKSFVIIEIYSLDHFYFIYNNTPIYSVRF